MMRALSAGVQGLKAHQTKMDVIGNNIANVNTTAFKAARVNFAEMYNQTLQGATSPGSLRGGVNPKQIGLGVSVASIENIQEPGALQATGKSTDMAISGNGFFVLRDGGRYVYTRAGNFDFDSQGYLVNPSTGQRVQGWLPNSQGAFDTGNTAAMTDIQLPVADSVLASPTKKVTFDQSLNDLAPIYAGTTDVNPATAQTSMTVIDSKGNEHSILLKFFKVAANQWDIMAYDSAGLPLQMSNPYGAGNNTIQDAGGSVNASTLVFNADGSLKLPAGATTFPPIQLTYAPSGGTQAWDGTANNLAPLQLDFSQVIQPAMKGTNAASTIRMLQYDGYPTGALDRIYVDAKGVVTGYYTNGQYREVAQVATANFFNPGGLMKDGNNNWVESPNSGWALIGAAGEAGRGTIASENLEMSNVDISQQFTDMIVTQRGFQANSRIITTADEMLQEVVNLKR
jgi:flagellar hook protein FlgE